LDLLQRTHGFSADAAAKIEKSLHFSSKEFCDA
jgi:hypothetical protein